MTVRKLLLPLIGTQSGESALALALMAAHVWKAHVHAIHVRADPRDVAPLAGEGLSGAMIKEMIVATEREADQRSLAVRRLFDHMLERYGVPDGLARAGEMRPSASFAASTGREDDVIAQEARIADLTVVPHPETVDESAISDALHAVLFDSGRPVLIAPAATPPAIGERICLAWNGTAESASAVAAALPWIARATAVGVLASDEYHRRGPGPEALIEYLELHGVSAELISFRPNDRDVGRGLLASAAEFGCDFLAMGAYSHSRLRQLLLGGVTRYVLEHAAIPVMMNR